MCGRGQRRQCFCGTTIARGPVVCPTCGADWSRLRRGSRSARKRVSRRDLAVNALIGGAIAVVSAGVLYFLMTGGVQRLVMNVSAGAPGAWQTASRYVSIAAAPAAVFLFGCLVGAARYYVALRAKRLSRRKRQRRKRSKAT